ncbi:DUF1206 domain-containing protein [Stakelama sp. CBK3Z-3]|uniref:DUF1206 domain-containing protein n=1 Tax=Stakelama flava TaxID=2860338 RepID=A0ABS6XIR1_9SPHN|nr:DUF1206 domain-containing protein [Stakelama flava]MBW4330104.1 DUF1206 domain-containing protein [Stakelama flava]
MARLEYFARAGYLARAIVYFLLGYLTFVTSRAEGTASVLEDIQDLPAGTIVLAVTGLGLAGYGFFRIYGALIDIQDDGHGAKGLGKRCGHVASGIAHLILTYLAFKVAFMGGSSGGGGGNEATQKILSFPGGSIVIAIVAIGFLLAGFNQALKAITGKFERLLDPDVPHWGVLMGRVGYAARSVVFLVLGWHLLTSAWSNNANQVGFQAALDALGETPWLYDAVALGLLIFGLFSLVMARYRTIRDGALKDRIRAGKVKLLF